MARLRDGIRAFSDLLDDLYRAFRKVERTLPTFESVLFRLLLVFLALMHLLRGCSS